MDGTLTTLWGNTEPYYGGLIKKQIYFNQAIRLKTTVSSISILKQPAKVVEGKYFSEVIKLQVFNENFNPVANKFVISSIFSFNGVANPLDYDINYPGRLNKMLLRPFSGVYHLDAGNPLNENVLYFPVLTDISGIIDLTNLAFSQ